MREWPALREIFDLRNYVEVGGGENFSWQVKIVAATLVGLTGFRQTNSVIQYHEHCLLFY